MSQQATETDLTSRNPSRLVPATAIATAALLFLLWPTLTVLHDRWTTGFSYTHGYLVLAMAGWLVYRQLRASSALRLEAWWPALIGVLGIGVVIVVAQIIGIDIGQQLLLPPLVAAIVLGVGGFGLLRACLPGICFIYFAIPMWDVLVTPLQQLTTMVVSIPLQWHEFPVLIDGFRVSVPAGEFEIAGGCSGLHFVIVSLTIGVFFAATDLSGWSDRVKTIAVALALALITNWVRVYTLIIVGQYSDMQHYLITTDHYMYGWVLYGVAMIVFFWYVRRFEPAARLEKAPGPRWMPGSGVAMALVAAGSIMAATAALRVAAWSGPQPGAALDVSVSAEDGVVLSAGDAEADWHPVLAGPTATRAGSGTYAGQPFEWYLAVYARQTNNEEIVAWGNRPFGKDWQSVAPIEVGPGLRGAVIGKARTGQRLIVWRQRVAGVAVYGRLNAKLRQLTGLIGGDRSADFVALSTACGTDCFAQAPAFAAMAGKLMNELQLTTSNDAKGTTSER